MESANIHKLLSEKYFDASAIKQWVFAEHFFWSQMAPSITASAKLQDPASIHMYLEALQKAVDEFNKNPQMINTISAQRLAEFSREYYLPNHDNPIANDLKRLEYNSSEMSTLLMIYRTCQISIDSFYKDEHELKYKKLFIEKHEEFRELSEKIHSENSAVLEIAEKSKSDLENYISDLKIQTSEELSSAGKEQSEIILDVSTKIQKTITSNEPVIFWETKEKFHRTQAKKCKNAAIALGCCAGVVLLLLIFAAFKDQDTTEWLGFKLPNHFYIAASILIGSAFVWALRVSIQLMMTHIALESEALEKSTAIKTYVALSSQNIDSDIEKDFHKALLTFNKIKIAEDSNHPELLKLIEQFLSKNKGT